MATKKAQARRKLVDTSKELKKLQSLWLQHANQSIKAYNRFRREMRNGNDTASDKHYVEAQKEMKAYERVHKKWVALYNKTQK